MAIKKIINKTVIFYTFFTLFWVLFFLWYLFPSDYFADYLEKIVKARGKGVVAVVESVKPVFPVGVKLTGLELTVPVISTLKTDYLHIKPGLFSLIKFNPEIHVEAGLLGGVVQATLKIPDKDINKLSVEDISLKGLDIKLLAGLAETYIPGYTISGKLDAEGNYSPAGRGKGKAGFIIRQLKVKPETPYFTLESVSFSEITAGIELKRQRIQIEKCNIDGLEFDGTIKGSVLVKFPLPRTVLRLSGKFKPEKEFIEKMPLDLLFKKKVKFGDELPFKISGTINKPRFR